MTIELDKERINIPETGNLTLKSKKSGILPFNMDLDGILLKYATLQPITHVEVEGIKTFFFGIIEGMQAEFMFEGNIDGGQDIDTLWEGANTRIRVSESETRMIRLEDNSGKTIDLCVLSPKDFQNFWRVNIEGQEHIILCERPPLVKEGRLELDLREASEIEMGIYPPVKNPLKPDTDSKAMISHGIKEGFETYAIQLPQASVASSYVINNNKARIYLSDEDFNRFDDLWLQVDYEGDVGNALVGGNLIQDNFYNGQVWEMGLGRFRKLMSGKPLDIHIRPKRVGDFIMLESDMALQRKFAGSELASINNVEFIPKRILSLHI